jgi:hypothetical protein
MNMITGPRPPAPPVAPAGRVTEAGQPARAPAVEAARAVAGTVRYDAPAPVVATTAVVKTRLAERDEGHHPAAEARIAADAARDAYIKASIAAGLSPLPLP